MSKKTAAIITPHGLFNYGNRLQNRALDHNLSQRGFEVTTLILKPDYPGPVLRDIGLKVGHTLRLRGKVSDKYRSFQQFDRTLRKRRVLGLKHLERIGEDYDLYVCGSDQIWNPHRSDLSGAEFGEFISHGRKVAISPSFGVEQLPPSAQAKLPARLASFDALSVREHAGQEIIHQATGKRVPVLIDPTMSIGTDKWRELASDRLRPQKPYVFVYLLGEQTGRTMAGLQDFASAQKLEVVTIMRRDLPKYFHAGPQDFLGLIEGAEYVVSDSYHAAIFSLLFETEFQWVERAGEHSMSSRFETLLRLFGLTLEVDKKYGWSRLQSVTPGSFGATLAVRRHEYDSFIREAVADA